MQYTGGGVRPVSQVLSPSKGFTLLELIVVIGVISILIGALLSRIPFYQELGEKTAMEQTTVAIQNYVVMRAGALMARGDTDGKGWNALTVDNPIGWLQQKPVNYAGEFFDPAPNAVAPGHWIFDLKSRELIYIPDHNEYLNPGKDGRKWIRFHVKLEYESPAGSAPGGKKELSAAVFEAAEPYHWFD